MSGDAQYPPSMWAQRSDVIFLTFNVECKNPIIEIKKDSLYFKGVGLPENKEYEGKIQLYSEIVPEECKKHNTGRCIQVLLSKAKKTGPFWPSLTAEKKKLHWLKVDFAKMQDENDSGDENPQYLSDMLSSFGGLGGNDEKPSFDDIESDSDDEDLPDLE